MNDTSRIARAMWTLFEPVHAITYFSPECRGGFEQAGLRGFWRGYFAGRSAPLGPVGAGPVIAIYSGFAPDFVRRALPAVWSLITPERALEVRRAGAVATLRRLVPDDSEVDQAAAALEPVAARVAYAGHPLGAANAELPTSDEPYARLWQAATVLREHRGDAHVAALVAADIAGLDVILLRCGLDLPRDLLQPARGWTDDDWAAGTARLVADGLLDETGSATAAGRSRIAAAEELTDRIAAGVWHSLSADECGLVAKRLAPIARACDGDIPRLTPIGHRVLWDVEGDPDAAAVAAPGDPA